MSRRARTPSGLTPAIAIKDLANSSNWSVSMSASPNAARASRSPIAGSTPRCRSLINPFITSRTSMLSAASCIWLIPSGDLAEVEFDYPGEDVEHRIPGRSESAEHGRDFREGLCHIADTGRVDPRQGCAE